MAKDNEGPGQPTPPRDIDDLNEDEDDDDKYPVDDNEGVGDEIDESDEDSGEPLLVPTGQSPEDHVDQGLMCDICGGGPYKTPGGLRLHKINKHKLGKRDKLREEPRGQDGNEPILKGPETVEARMRERLISTLEIAPYMSVDKMTWTMRIWDNTPAVRRSARELYSLLMSLDRMTNNTAKWIVDLVFTEDREQNQDVYFSRGDGQEFNQAPYPEPRDGPQPQGQSRNPYDQQPRPAGQYRYQEPPRGGPEEETFTKAEVQEIVEQQVRAMKEKEEMDLLKKRILELEQGGGANRGQTIRRSKPVIGPDGKPVYDRTGKPMFEVIELPVEEYKLELMQGNKTDVGDIIEKVVDKLKPSQAENNEIKLLREKLDNMEKDRLAERMDNNMKVLEERSASEIGQLRSEIRSRSAIDNERARSSGDMSDEAKVALQELRTTAEMGRTVLSNVNNTVNNLINVVGRGGQPMQPGPKTKDMTEEEQDKLRRKLGQEYVIE